jgi:hypothetical protein
LFFEENEATSTVDVTVASLDSPEACAPTKIIWTEDKLPWVKLDETLPSFLKSSSSDIGPTTAT